MKDILADFRKGCNHDNISDPPSDTKWLESFLLQSCREAVEFCRVERKKFPMPYTNKKKRTMEEIEARNDARLRTYCFNQAIAEASQKEREFFEE